MHTYGTLTQVKTSTKAIYTDKAGTATVTITCDWSDVATYTPAIGASYSGDTQLKLSNIQQETIGADLGKITLTYTGQLSESDGPPATTYNEQSSQIEAPIEEHPNFDDWSDDYDDEAGAFKFGTEKYGIKSYIKGTTTVTVTTYHTSNPSSDRGSLGTKQNPGGGYGDSGHWLLIGSNRSKNGNFYTKANQYLYSDTEWNDDIYDG